MIEWQIAFVIAVIAALAGIVFLVRFLVEEKRRRSIKRRWVFPVDEDARQLIESFDRLKMIIDPSVTAKMAAQVEISREWDERLMNAAMNRRRR